jgi:hypothetical protein
MGLRDHVLVRACRALNQGIDGEGWRAMGHRQKSWVRPLTRTRACAYLEILKIRTDLGLTVQVDIPTICAVRGTRSGSRRSPTKPLPSGSSIAGS